MKGTRSAEAGSALIEFAGSLILLAVMFSGIFEIGYSFYTYGELVSAVRPFIGAYTPLYSVGQNRETVSPYLGRTLQLAGYEGELQFGLREEPQRRMTLEQFASRWSAADQGVAFFDPQLWDSWRRRGFPGRVIAADNYTVAVSRL